MVLHTQTICGVTVLWQADQANFRADPQKSLDNFAVELQAQVTCHVVHTSPPFAGHGL